MTSSFEHRAPEVSDDDLAPGRFLGRYQITRLIGRGGMGCVYEAVHRDLGKRVAIKTLLPSLAVSPEARGRFLREGQAASRIRHPHVVDVTDVVAEGATSYLVMEYLEGEDLASLIERQGALPLAEAADLLLPVIAAIAAAHELGVIHRDLKPENIFLARGSFGGPCPKVVDFGISKVLGDPTAIALTATSAVFGTMFYLPPELLGGSREADGRGDQYALGAILYECVTGHRAFEGTSIYGVLKSVAEGVYPPARSWRPDLPPRLEATIDRAMRLNPAARFASVRVLGAELLMHASAAVRTVWAPVFGECAADATAGRMGTGTMLLPVLGEWRLGVATFPPAAGDDDLLPELARAPRAVAIGVACVIAAAAVVSGVRRRAVPLEAVGVSAGAGVSAGGAASGAVDSNEVVVAPPAALPRSPLVSPPPPVRSPPGLPPPMLLPAPLRRTWSIKRHKPRARGIERAGPSDSVDGARELRTNVPTID